MAGFCKNCGSPLADGQGVCGKCGVAAGAAPVRPASQAPFPSAQAAATQAKSNRTLIKVLLICGGVIVFFGIAGVASIGYFIYRHKDTFHQMGFDDPQSMQYHGPVLGGADPCTLLSKEDVSEVVRMPVVRVEAVLAPDVGCEYSVMGDRDYLISSHISAVTKAPATMAQRRDMETMARSFFHSSNRQPTTYVTVTAPRHPGEAPVFAFIVDNNAPKVQMGMTRTAMNRLSPGTVTELTAVGEDAFDLGGALIMARQGNTVVRAMYLNCPCTTQEALPLVRKIVSNISEK
jgi:hypothetical protein